MSRFKFGLVWSWVGCGVWDEFGGWVGFGFSIGFGVSGWVWGFELDLSLDVGLGRFSLGSGLGF